MIKKVEFPQYTNAGINTSLVADKLNEVIDFLNEKYPEVKPNVFTLGIVCTHESAYDLKRSGNWKCRDCKKIFKKLV